MNERVSLFFAGDDEYSEQLVRAGVTLGQLGIESFELLGKDFGFEKTVGFLFANATDAASFKLACPIRFLTGEEHRDRVAGRLFGGSGR